MTPKSMINDRREKRQIKLVFAGMLAITALLWWISLAIPDFYSWKYHWLVGPVYASTVLCSVITLVMLFMVGITALDDYDLPRHRNDFIRTFGDDPNGDPEVVQRTVSAVLENLRASAQGAFGREVGSQRQHAQNPSAETVQDLNDKKQESRNRKKVFWYAVAVADDWNYAVPKSIDEKVV